MRGAEFFLQQLDYTKKCEEVQKLQVRLANIEDTIEELLDWEEEIRADLHVHTSSADHILDKLKASLRPKVKSNTIQE